MNRRESQSGFTLVQLIITVAIIVILGAAAFIWIDPVTKIGKAKDERRRHDILIIAKAINDYATDNNGVLPVLGGVTTAKKVFCETQGGSLLSCGTDSEHCLKADSHFMAEYLPQLPLDPDKTSGADTGYYLQKDANNKLVVGSCTKYGSTAITHTLNLKVICNAYGGGHCWYSDDSQNDCSTVCAGLSKLCVKGATYDADTLCLLNDAANAGYTCEVDCSTTSSAEPPFILDDSSCGTMNGIFSCSQGSGAGFSICPCE